MKPAPTRPLWQGRSLALVGILLLAFSLRSAVASLSPLFDYIERDFTLSASVIGLIATVPPVCFAVFGLLTPAFERRLGLEPLAVLAFFIVALGLVARSFATNAMLMLAGTTIIFAAIGVANILLPPLVKRYFPDRIGLITGLYSATMAVSTFLPPLIAVPVADTTNWRASLGMWALFALMATVPWIALISRARASTRNLDQSADVEPPNPRVFSRMLRLPSACALMVGFSAAGVVAYTSFSWLPRMLVDTAGVTPVAAGVLLSLFAAVGLPASLVVPLLVVRYHATRALYGIAVTAGLVGIAGLLWAPALAPWLWVLMLSGPTLLFPLTLVLLNVRTSTHEGAVALSGFVQSVGYGLGAVFPLTIGLIHEATGSWTIPLIMLALAVSAAVPAGVVASRRHTVEEEWERKHGAW
ncbi:MFS transporter [Microbacterium sp. NPDC076911]|uniref:MFS transporter n=1 Tax=Microbacterium sp. NPDC076911 TaxID=3154958 RepID=UPI00344711AC